MQARTLSIAASLCLVTSPGLAYEYSAKAIHGWIVDAATREPVGGAVVVAEWQLEYGLEGGSGYSWIVLEAVTDAKGRFAFPAWGPRPVPAFLPAEARLKDRDPKIVFFKYGYGGVQQTTQQAGKEYGRDKDFRGRGPRVRGWLFDGETFSYRPAMDDPDRIAAEILSFDLFLSALRAPCSFVHTARALRALKRARERLAAEAPQAGERLRYGRPAYQRWLDGSAAVEAAQKRECGTTARDALERTGE